MDIFLEILYDNGMRRHVQAGLLFFSLFYMTLYTPVFCVVYSPYWYTINCRFHGRCERIGMERARLGIQELTAFYRHTQNSLAAGFWTDKEKQHLAEIRPMLDILFITGMASLALFCVCYRASHIRRFALINTAIILLLIVILPFFSYFWRRIFHPLLFHNMNWLNTPSDFSFYILPRVFFRNTLIFMVLTSSLINIFLVLITRIRYQSKVPHQTENIV